MRRGYWISIISLGLLLAVLLASPGCAKAAPVINSPDAANLIQQNADNPDFMILDVRTPDEFNSEHLANAMNIDYESPDFEANVGGLDRNKQYLVYCKGGKRSSAATRIMVKLGFKEVYNLSQGITQWTEEGYPVDNSALLGKDSVAAR